MFFVTLVVGVVGKRTNAWWAGILPLSPRRRYESSGKETATMFRLDRWNRSTILFYSLVF